MMKQFIKTLFVFIFSILFVGCSSTPQKTPVIINVQDKSSMPVLSSQEQKKYSDALQQMKLQNFEVAEQSFHGLLESHPRLAGAMVNLGLIQEKKKEKEKALAFYEAALKVNPNNVVGLIQSALQYQSQGKFKVAEDRLRRANAIDKKNPVVNYNLGVLYELYLQEYDLAIKYYQAYVDVSENEDVATVKRWIKLLERK